MPARPSETVLNPFGLLCWEEASASEAFSLDSLAEAEGLNFISSMPGVFYGIVELDEMVDPLLGAQRTRLEPEVTAAPPYRWRP